MDRRAASVASLAVSGGLFQWSFGAFVPDLEREFGWSRAQVTGAPSLGFLTLALASPLVGAWVDRFSIRSGLLFGAVMTSGFVALLATVQTLWQFYLLYLVTAFFRTWTSYIPVNALLNRWFDRYRGRAVGLSTAGFGLGGVIFAPLVTFFVQQVGWRSAYLLSALIMLVIMIPLALLVIRDRPEQMGLQPDGHPPPEAEARGRRGVGGNETWSLRDAVRTPSFWVLNAAIAFLWTPQVSYGVHGQPFFESRGYAAAAAASILGASSLAAAVLRGASGFVYDWFRSPRLLAFGLCASGAAALFAVTVSTAAPALALFFILWGIGSGGSSIMPPLMLARYYGSRHLGAMLGFTEMTSSLMVLGPIIGGVLYHATGSYTASFLFFGATMGASGLLFLASSPPPKGVHSPQSEEPQRFLRR